jgi:hypothetical protein
VQRVNGLKINNQFEVNYVDIRAALAINNKDGNNLRQNKHNTRREHFSLAANQAQIFFSAGSNRICPELMM